MTTNPIHTKDGVEWRSPTNLKSGISNGEPARVRWPEDASKPLADHEVPWKYGYLVWDYWMDHSHKLHPGQVQFMWAKDKLMHVTNPKQVQVQRQAKGIGR